MGGAFWNEARRLLSASREPHAHLYPVLDFVCMPIEVFAKLGRIEFNDPCLPCYWSNGVHPIPTTTNYMRTGSDSLRCCVSAYTGLKYEVVPDFSKDPDPLDLLSRWLHALGYQCIICSDPEELWFEGEERHLDIFPKDYFIALTHSTVYDAQTHAALYYQGAIVFNPGSSECNHPFLSFVRIKGT